MGIILFVLSYLVLATFMLVPLLGIGWVAKRMRAAPGRAVLVVASTLLLTPSWGPATITWVTVPFGMPLAFAVLDWHFDSLWEMIGLFPRWHAVAFPVTAVLAYLVARKLLPARPRSEGETA